MVAPLAVTAVVLQFVLARLAVVLDPVVRETRLTALTGNVEVAAQLVALLLVALFVTALGLLAQRTRARVVFEWFDRFVGLVPLVSVVYTGVRQVSNTLVSRDTRYRSAVIVEYPRPEVYSLGFLTGDAPEAAADLAGGEAYTVVVPHSPNPTAGHLVFVPADRVHETDLSVRDALRMVVTTGIAESESEMAAYRDSVDEGDLPSLD
ncbi:DUF502 domain-containing protein [Halosegnis marinus]|uniref:DUF502 domain-containing protein n=1 Tax=Halosegnis marinus TaxID=3034023 RepID=UPI0036146C84